MLAGFFQVGKVTGLRGLEQGLFVQVVDTGMGKVGRGQETGEKRGQVGEVGEGKGQGHGTGVEGLGKVKVGLGQLENRVKFLFNHPFLLLPYLIHLSLFHLPDALLNHSIHPVELRFLFQDDFELLFALLIEPEPPVVPSHLLPIPEAIPVVNQIPGRILHILRLVLLDQRLQ